MFKVLIFIAIAILAQPSRTDSFEFKITKELINGEKLDKEKWINVKVTKNGSSESDGFSFAVTVPLSIPFSNASIFFANETKEILQVFLHKTVQGKFFRIPYQVQKTMKGDELTITKTDRFQLVSGSFPKSWVPEKSNRVSAAVVDEGGTIYNYYGLRNSGISILDLLVLEEYVQNFPSA